MKKLYILLLALSTSFYTSAQIKISDFDDAKIYFDGVFNSYSEDSGIDEYGNIYIDMGSASSGRHYFRITDVNLSIEEKPEEPGCADICPPRVIISFKCRKSVCLQDPTIQGTGYIEGAIVFENIARGKKAFEFLKAFREFVLKSIE